ncbi:dihydrodipicolinate synthase family protein [Rhizobium sp. RM]|uniref:dihydrodipicolinate synthase family protein n=1 Tax=Rhizobium sp. RM TaxID=2748079 RepID=UPI00110D9A8C|nr:dihydrodipicolinate synthase family protein [Rhizobium sp. RM]NWJ27050.1 dihydrodipicolinate synthase family protein [Rhizobium sp. RM]TMV22906.1 dihydrodipicolinate synthase family protein [Rhizobium sp. Td3]
MTQKFGLSAALTTPFKTDGSIDIDAMIAHARRCLSSGCNSVTLFGTTGEGSSIGSIERQTILSRFIEAGIAPSSLVTGVLVDSIEDAALQSAEALKAGARNILLAPPSYFKNVSDDGLFAWFSAVFEKIGKGARDILVYNIPSVTMVTLSVDLVGRLKTAFPGIVTGVKDSSGNWPHTERLLKEHGDLAILIGDERDLAKGVRLGGHGAISGVANFLPQEVRAMAVDGKDDKRIEDLVVELLKFPVTPAVKVLLSHTTGENVWLEVRAPLVAVSPEDRGQIGAAFDTLFRKQAA